MPIKLAKGQAARLNRRLFEKEFKRLFNKEGNGARRKVLRAISGASEQIILDVVNVGLSPVSGEGRFMPYEPSYVEEINKKYSAKYGKRIRPINLKLSGDMQKSYYSKYDTNKAEITIGFKDKKARHHYEGIKTKRGFKKRKLLPQNRETFIGPIIKKFYEIAKKALK